MINMTINEQIRAYVILIERGRMTLDEVPEELKSEVEKLLVTDHDD